MSENAFEFSAKYYDLIYADKDYEKETAFIEDCIRHYGSANRILELGCGTGNYSRVLSSKGYRVTGIDSSERMIDIAKKKVNGTFLKLDIRDFSLSRRFDCCLALFAVLGYITSNSDFEIVLKNVRNHLKMGGLFVFDVWNGLAVLRCLPEERVKKVEDAKMRLTRFVHPVLRAIDHICEVNYRFVVETKASGSSKAFEEKHLVRFYFPKELEYYLYKARFELLRFCPFMDFEGVVSESVWNMTVVARAV